MKFSLSNNAAFYLKIFIAFILVFVAFNYTWGYAQRLEGHDSTFQNAAAPDIDTVVSVKESTGTKLMLTWTIDPQRKVSHFILERSNDGKLYNEAALVFTGDEDTGNYDYSEKIKRADTGVVFYRLKAVDKEGKFSYPLVKATVTDAVPTGNQTVSK